MSRPSPPRQPLLERLAARRAALEIRHAVVSAIRAWFAGEGFVEIETPLLLRTVAPEEHIRPIRCGRRFLATSPELQMKQLLAAGYDRIFQVTRSFRSGERGSRHVPEFTILEWYRTGESPDLLVTDLEGLVGAVARGVAGGLCVEWQGRTVDLSPPWPRLPVRDAFRTLAGWDPVEAFDQDRFDLDLVERVEPELGLGRPQFLELYPVQQASLARAAREDPRTALRMELYVEGLELANGFVELTDPAVQAERFREVRRSMRRAGGVPPPMPASFLESMEDLPPSVGMALGVDRLVMLFADAPTIDHVRAFAPEEA